MTNTASLVRLAVDLGEVLRARKWRVATAESCTGGGGAAAITAVAGSSAWLEYGLVTYAYVVQLHFLGIDNTTLASDGGVSESVVRQMTVGALALSRAE